MSGIAPRKKAAFDPLMNPGDAPPADTTGDAPTVDSSLSQPLAKSSLALSKEVPVSEVLAKLALKHGENPDDDSDPPAQSMAEFLGEAPGGALFDQLQKSKKGQLFDDTSDNEDEATKERKAKRRAAVQAEIEAQKKQAAAAANAAADALLARHNQPEVVVPSSRPAHLALATSKKTQAQKDLFEDEEDDASATEGAKGLQGVYIPEGAAEYHTDETKHKTEAIDAKLLEEPDDADLEELGALVAKTSKASAPSAAAQLSASGAAAASAASAATDDLDDDLFSFGSSNATKSGASTVDPSAPDFDFNSYIKTGAASTSKAASLFDDDD